MQLKYSRISSCMESCAKHSHDSYEVCMNLEGDTVNYIENNETVMKCGDIFLCAPGVSHHKRAISGTFKDIFINFNCDDIFPSDFKGTYFEDSDGAVMKLLEIIHKLYNSDSPEKHNALVSLTESVVYILKGKFDNIKPLSPAVNILKSCIIENFTNPEFKISDCKEYSYYNKDYMRQIFKKETGLSPLDYLCTLRLKNAVKLLSSKREPQYMINEISFLCGFYDVGYFTRIFRKRYGVTPSEFRKSKQTESLNTENNNFSCCYSEDLH